MKIVHVLGNFKLPQNPDEGASGVVRAALEIARAQTHRGHEVTVVAVGQKPWEVVWNGVRVAQLEAVPWAKVQLGGRTLDFSTHTPLVRLSRRCTFDVIHGHLYYYLRFLRARARVVHFHADPFYDAAAENVALERAALAKRADFSMIARTSDAQVAVSRFIAHAVDRAMRGVGTRRSVHTVYNGVVHERFGSAAAADAGAALRRTLGVARDAVVFLFVGAVVPEKGLEHLANAFQSLAAAQPQAHLLVAGSASLWDMSGGIRAHRGYEAAVAESLRPLIEAGRVHLLGATRSALMPAVYAASDVVVIPSVWPEPFPLVALEALAAGKPLVASAVGGLPETVDTENGRLVPPGDEAALAAALCTLLRSEVRERCSRAASRTAGRFSWDTAATQLEDVYETSLVRA